MIVLVPVGFLAVVLGTLWLVRWRSRRVTLIAPVVTRVRATSPYRTPARRSPSRGF